LLLFAPAPNLILNQTRNRADLTAVSRAITTTPFQHPSVAPSHIAPPVLAKSMFLPVIDGSHDAFLCT
jgi:hypothetical protein